MTPSDPRPSEAEQAKTPTASVRAMLAELARPSRHRQQRLRLVGSTTYSEPHTIRVPSLIDQLEGAIASAKGDRSGAGYESRPAARIEAIDTLLLIEQGTTRWLNELDLDNDDTLATAMRRLTGALPDLALASPRAGRHRIERAPDRSVVCCDLHRLEADVRRWYNQARIVTGWDQPPWSPDATCPACGRRGSLRIRLEERVGMCTECRETWDAGGYQQLAAHIRDEADQRGASEVRPCACWWPRVEIGPLFSTSLDALCPRCGSASCRNARRLAGIG